MQQAATETRAYELEADKQSRAVAECDQAIEFFEKQVKGYSDQLQSVADDLEVPDDTIVEIEQRILDGLGLALAFEQEAQDHEQQVVFLFDAVLAAVKAAPAGTRVTIDVRSAEQARRAHERLARTRGERVTKRQSALDQQQKDAQRLLDARKKHRGGKPSPAKGNVRVAALRQWKRAPAPFKPTQIRRGK